MQAEIQNKWKKAEPEQFKSIVQTRRQIREATSVHNEKKVKSLPSEQLRQVDLALVDEHAKRIGDQTNGCSSTGREFLTKFVEKRLGITVKADGEDKPMSARKEATPLKANDPLPIIESVKEETETA